MTSAAPAAVRIAVVALAYFAAGKLGLALAVVHASASAVWPPTGIALAAVMLLGARAWPGIFAGAFLVNLTTAGTIVTSLSIAAGNTLEALVGAALLQRFARGKDAFCTPHGVFAFALLAGLLSTTVSPTLGVTSLALAGFAAWREFGEIWLNWWLGDVVGTLIVAPPIVLWALEPRLRWRRERAVEAALLAAALMLVGLFVFGAEGPVPLQLKFVSIPPLLWAALRFTSREAATAVLLLSGLAVRGIYGRSNQELLVLQAFMGVAAVMALAAAAEAGQRRRAEEELRAANEALERRVAERTAELRAAVERAAEAQRLGRVGTWDWDVTGDRVSWSDEMYRLFGLRPGELAVDFDGFLQRVHPGDRERVKAAVLASLANGEAFAFDQRVVWPDGSVRWLQSQGGVVVDAAGRPLRMAGTGRDITERKKAELLFRAVLESAPDAMLICDREGRIVMANARVESLFLWSREELQGQTLERLVPARYRDAHRLDRDAYFARPRTRPMGPGLELFGLRKNGTEFHVEISLSPLETEEGLLVIAAVRDISDRKDAERALREHAQELARSNADLERFAHMASHDLQEPLRMVASFTQLLARRYKERLDAEAREFIDFAVDGATRMQALVEDLLSYARVGSRELELRSVDSAAVLAQVVASLQPAMDESRGELSAGALPVVLADELQLGQLFQNLITNALKFHGADPPRVRVAAERAGRRWAFSVRDNGIGIAAEHQERIFVAFQRLHTRREYPGSGVGLAICKRIVERHGGRLWVESEPGGGSVFFFTLQASEA